MTYGQAAILKARAAEAEALDVYDRTDTPEARYAWVLARRKVRRLVEQARADALELALASAEVAA